MASRTDALSFAAEAECLDYDVTKHGKPLALHAAWHHFPKETMVPFIKQAFEGMLPQSAEPKAGSKSGSKSK
jgi:hypothetical protein